MLNAPALALRQTEVRPDEAPNTRDKLDISRCTTIGHTVLTQKKPAYPFQFHAVGFIMYVLRIPETIPTTLYRFLARPTVLDRSRVLDTSPTMQSAGQPIVRHHEDPLHIQASGPTVKSYVNYIIRRSAHVYMRTTHHPEQHHGGLTPLCAGHAILGRDGQGADDQQPACQSASHPRERARLTRSKVRRAH